MSQAKAGDTVKIHYTGTLDDGSEFDSSSGRDPLEFTVGSGQVIPGFDKAVEGMAVGDQKKVRIEAEDAEATETEEAVEGEESAEGEDVAAEAADDEAESAETEDAEGAVDPTDDVIGLTSSALVYA